MVSTSAVVTFTYVVTDTGDTPLCERGPGLGLGLYIAKRLVEAQGGTQEASSEPERGSRFRIVLPA